MTDQQTQIIRYLAQGKSLTVAKALTELGVYALSQRCGEIAKAGWPIESRWLELPNGKRVKEYFLRMPPKLELVA